MRFKKAQTGADFISFTLIGFLGTVILISLAVFVGIPLMEKRIEVKATTAVDNLQSNLFLLYYLDSHLDNKNIADVVSYSYANNDYTELTLETTNLLSELYGNADWKIIINDKEITNSCISGCRGKTKTYETLIPTISKNTIIFKIIIYSG